MKLLKNMLNIVDIVVETCYFHMNMNLLVFDVDSIYLKKVQTLWKTTKKINFINGLKNAAHKIFCICIDVYKIYEGDVYDKKSEVLSTIKKTTLKINKIIIKKLELMLERPDLEQDNWSRTATGIYRIGHDSIRIMKWICYFDRSYYENIN